MGTIIKLPNGKFRMVKQVGNLSNGNPKRISVTGTSETNCIRLLKKREAEISRNKKFESIRKDTVTVLCKKHLEEHLSEQDRLKPKSADRRESTINNQIMPYPLGRMQVASVDPSDIRNHIETLIREGKISVSSIEKALDVINSAYKWGCDQEYITNNPCKPVLDSLKNRLKNLSVKKSSDGIVMVLSDDQINKLIKSVDELIETSNKTYEKVSALTILLLLYTGMRAGELCALRWKDWSETTKTINIIKTRNVAINRKSKGRGDTYIPNENEVKNYHARTIKLCDEANEIMKIIKETTSLTGEDDYILLNRRNRPTNPSNFGKYINKMYEKLGLPDEVSGAHILRRTCATVMHNNGCRLEDIAAYLGDTPETIRKHYISTTKRVVADGKILNVVELPKKK